MEHPLSKRLKITSSQTEEVRKSPLSLNIHDDVIEQIFSFLPVSEATKNSIVAKRFEKSWQLSQHLCFGDLYLKKRSSFEFVYIIQHILTNHSGKNIVTFELRVDPAYIESLINSWIKLVVSKEPKVIHLDFVIKRSLINRSLNIAPYEIPLDIINSESIQVLRLSNCLFNLPSKFEGLHFLQTLVLRHVGIKSSDIKTLIENCSILKSLQIVRCSEIFRLQIFARAMKFFKELKIGDCCELDHVYVDAPTLEIFHFTGKLETIALEGRMRQLRDVMLNYRVISYSPPRLQMENLMLQMSHIRVLTVSSTFLEDLCSILIHGSNVGEQKQCLWHVKEVQLVMDSTSFCNPFDLISFLHVFPHLENLFIDFQKFSFDEKSLYWVLHDRNKFENCHEQFLCLKLVKFSNFKFGLMDVKLAKFLLEKSPNLENFAIFTMKNFHLIKFTNVVLGCVEHLISWRSSLQAKVGVYEHGDQVDNDLVAQHHDLWYAPSD